MTAMLDQPGHFINGSWLDRTGGRDHPVISPATGAPLTRIPLAGPAEVDQAVAAARAALPLWSSWPVAERIACVERFLDLYEARAEELARAVSQEMGAPITLARTAQVPLGARHTRNYLAAARSFAFSEPLSQEHPETRLIHAPIGVCALITPWNWPLNQIALKVVAALLAGCTMVLKPSEQSPLSAVIVARCLAAAGLPPGVFNLIHGDGQGAGAALSAHPDVDMISFTGSTRAGVAISQAAAATLKRVTLELGGKGANIIFADADPEALARGLRQAMNNSGQSCIQPGRMLLERTVYDQSLIQLAQLVQAYRPGRPDDEGPHMGPVVNAAQWARVQGLIQGALDAGARLIAGGPGRPRGFEQGYWVHPTILADVTPQMDIFHEEVFGPVLCVTPFDTEAEAIALANDTVYGLANYVQSGDLARAKRVAAALHAGMIEINGKVRGPGAPIGGIKRSGNGREGGIWGLREFLEVKAISGWAEDTA